MNALELHWAGPYALIENGGRSAIYDLPEAATPGIYLWSVLRDERYRINYIGIARESVASRQAKHLREYLSGAYSIYEPGDFARGRRTPLYQPKDGLTTFLSKYRELSDALFKHLALVHFFFAPLENTDGEILERIESSIITAVRDAGGAAYEFLDNLRISRKCPPERISVKVHDHGLFEGMPEELKV